MKKLSACLFAAALCAAGAPAAAQERPYLEPALRALLDASPGAAAAIVLPTRPAGVEIPGLERPAERTRGGALAIQRSDVDGTLLIGVFVRLRSPAGLDELRAAGAEIGSVIGDIATARVPVDALAQLADARWIAVLEAERVVLTNHDSSMRAIRADRVRQVVGGTWTGATGVGALVGVYDTGLDFRHGDFLAADGTTRVAGLWDQTIGGAPPPGFQYGFYCTRAAIQAAIGGTAAACPQRDLNGHGTHVAGSAAGDGSAGTPAFRFAGVAPEAELLIVKGGEGSFTETRIIDGFVWLKQRAEELGRPIAVNLSVGGHGGAHDGSRLFEQAIDQLSAPGYIVVTSAGNSGHNFNTTPPENRPLIHARGLPLVGQTTQFTFAISEYNPHPNACAGNVVHFSLWHSPADRLRLTITRPNGTAASAAFGEVRVDNAPTGQILIDNGSGGPSPENGEIEIFFRVSGCDGSGVPAPGAWRIGVTTESGGSGTPYDIWLIQQFMGTNGLVSGVDNFDNRFNVTTPGTARRVITVGAFATKMCWTAATGQEFCYTNRETIGDIARFSSAGPTRDGRMKPEITAPGIAIVSALSLDAGAPPARIVGNRHWVLEGTSMASPHVAGAIAVLLAERPDLTPEDIIAIFGMTAQQDQFTSRTYGPFAGGSPEDWWGFGKLDVEAALNAIVGDRPVARIAIVPPRDTMPQGATLQLRIDAFGPDEEPVFARASWQSTAPDVATVDDRGLVRAIAPGTALIIATVQEHSDTAVIVVQPPAILTLASESAAPASPVRAPRATRLPLLSLRLAASGPEAIDVLQLGFDVTGDDAGARIVVLRDVAGDGTIGPDDPELGSVPATLTPTPSRVIVPLTLRVPRNAAVDLIVAVQVSGAAPNLAEFRATLVPAETRTVGVRSGATDRISVASPPIASAPAVTTLLQAGQAFSLSENPVRGAQLILNFSDRPRTVAVYTVAGARVADLTSRLDTDTQIRWDLTNDRAQRIAPGIYLLIVETAGQTIREKLFVMTPAQGGME